MLPNDPRLKELTPFQCIWIIANMNEEALQHKKALNGDKENYTIDTANFDPGAFAALAMVAQNGITTNTK